MALTTMAPQTSHGLDSQFAFFPDSSYQVSPYQLRNGPFILSQSRSQSRPQSRHQSRSQPRSVPFNQRHHHLSSHPHPRHRPNRQYHSRSHNRIATAISPQYRGVERYPRHTNHEKQNFHTVMNPAARSFTPKSSTNAENPSESLPLPPPIPPSGPVQLPLQVQSTVRPQVKRPKSTTARKKKAYKHKQNIVPYTTVSKFPGFLPGIYNPLFGHPGHLSIAMTPLPNPLFTGVTFNTNTNTNTTANANSNSTPQLTTPDCHGYLRQVLERSAPTTASQSRPARHALTQYAAHSANPLQAYSAPAHGVFDYPMVPTMQQSLTGISQPFAGQYQMLPYLQNQQFIQWGGDPSSYAFQYRSYPAMLPSSIAQSYPPMAQEFVLESGNDLVGQRDTHPSTGVTNDSKDALGKDQARVRSNSAIETLPTKVQRPFQNHARVGSSSTSSQMVRVEQQQYDDATHGKYFPTVDAGQASFTPVNAANPKSSCHSSRPSKDLRRPSTTYLGSEGSTRDPTTAVAATSESTRETAESETNRPFGPSTQYLLSIINQAAKRGAPPPNAPTGPARLRRFSTSQPLSAGATAGKANETASWSHSMRWVSRETKERIAFQKMMQKLSHIGAEKSPFVPQTPGSLAAFKIHNAEVKTRKLTEHIRKKEAGSGTHSGESTTSTQDDGIDGRLSPPPQLFGGKKIKDNLSPVFALRNCFNESEHLLPTSGTRTAGKSKIAPANKHEGNWPSLAELKEEGEKRAPRFGRYFPLPRANMLSEHIHPDEHESVYYSDGSIKWENRAINIGSHRVLPVTCAMDENDVEYYGVIELCAADLPWEMQAFLLYVLASGMREDEE